MHQVKMFKNLESGYKDLEAETEAQGKELLSRSDFEQMSLMKESLLAHEYCNDLLSDGIAERSIFHRDPVTFQLLTLILVLIG